MNNNVFSVDFGKLQEYLNDVFLNDDKSKEIIENAGFTESQVEIINTIILSALKAYDLQKQK